MIDLKTFRISKGWTQTELAKRLGVSRAMISQVEAGKTPFPELWEGKINGLELSNVKQLPHYDKSNNGKSIPFYDVDVYATISPVMSDMPAMKPSAFVNIPMFSQGEYAVQVTGNSMKGLINAGDWIVIKRITNQNAIIFGEPYLVITKSDNLKTVKFVKQSDDDIDSFCLIPYNIEQFQPQDMPKNEIIEMYKVVGLFRNL